MRFDPEKWYFQTYVYVIGFLCVGPFILPLAWINPRYNRNKKIFVTLITLILSYFLAVSFARSTETIYRYYKQMIQMSR